MIANQHFSDLAMSDLQQRLTKLISLGTVHEVDYETATVKVKMGDWITAKLPWLTAQAAHDMTWQAPEVGEQVMVLSPCGDTFQGVVLGSLYSQKFAPKQLGVSPENRPDVHKVQYQDGSSITYDRKSHRYLIDIQGADATVDVLSAGTLNITTAKDIRVETQANATVLSAKDATLKCDGSASVQAGGDVSVEGASIALNGGSPCVTTAHVCHFTGSPHGDGSSTVTAGK
ncbi:phage baseplate assembly protein V [Pseudoalteromonas piscicida]|uniref:Phage baseplate assembly protein V n=1 Tax=Pseudoalteromonas piscicida TaxID=43662 RepID=A0AAQ2EQQ0_PSEO7|nr:MULTISPECIES: phage baseplate assembly protein V [Pseudoalteromonas]KJY85639.1 baseplate assembly protein [Pseudoalteromonas piscicida]TMN34908.1 phage baseplate assembly protein V [Pseudoalteromonas piscicida]TMN39021.1 phage baseplate assembly protein V [Pseudoalteromonas piscicida]TMN49560.1 phage baseplate assembly protein V [Pseudoalteromonas piscicida]TMN50138.1 phage baseplate assembly protein V [Pseudoalteromonas piscicida]